MATGRTRTTAPGTTGPDRGLRVAVRCPDRQVRLELGLGPDVVWSDVWPLEVVRDGRRAAPRSPWEESIRISDDRVEYLELANRFDGGLHIERQILLAREDRFLLLADVVVARGPAKLGYRSRLPLGPATRFDESKEGREGFLVDRRRWGRVLPLALPECRAEACSGSLKRTEQGLELAQSSDGRGLFAPLFVDLDPQRFRRPLTWRRLTVAENLAAQPVDVAAGFRVQIGRQQWLIYRSLAARANRSLLGHNLSSEMLVARFQRNGEVDPLVETE